MATQKKSLVSQTQTTAPVQRVESNPGAGLPAELRDVFDLPAELRDSAASAEPLFQRTPYVQFVSTKGKAFAQVLPFTPDLLDGEPVLILPQPYPPRVQRPLRFLTVFTFRHWSSVDQTNAITKTWIDGDKAKASTRGRKVVDPATSKEMIEHVESVVLVLEGDAGITPARCTFKGTKAGAVNVAISTQQLITDHPETWRKMSDAHAAVAGAESDPRFQVVTTAERKTGTGGDSGFSYVAYNGKVRPAKLSELALFHAARRDPGFVGQLAECRRVWLERVRELQANAEE